MVDVNDTFSAWDYAVFSVLLALSAAVGVVFACTGGKQRTLEEYLMGDRNMNLIPVALSLLASFWSAATLLGKTVEIYLYGTQYWMICIGFVLFTPLAAHVFIPVFFRLQLTSVFEYLELRFSPGVRLCGALAYIIQMVLFLTIVLYTPSLALEAVTGLNVWISVCCIGAVCTFYTTLGGTKAVIWTDVLQLLVMLAGLISVLVRGSIDLNGFTNIWNIADEGDRVEFFKVDPDPLTRHSIWTLSIGGCFTWLAIYGVNQVQIQRALSCKNLRSAQIAMWMNLPGLIGLLTVCSLCGMVVYAQYSDCDPLQSGKIDHPDQLLPLYVVENMGHITGLTGLFTASLFSAALSTMSSGLNSLSAVTLQDVVRQYVSKDMKESKATTVSKIIALCYGVICTALTYVAAQCSSDVLEGGLGLFGIIGAPLLGLFSLGMIYPCANKQGAYVGFFMGLALTIWLGVGAEVYKADIDMDEAPVSVVGCNTTLLEDYVAALTEATKNETEKAGYIDFYALSDLYHAAFAVLSVTVIGLIVSFISGCNKDEEVDPQLICPVFDVFCCCLPEGLRKLLRCDCKEEKEKEKADESHLYSSRDILRGSYGMDDEEWSINYQRRRMSEIKYVTRKNSADLLNFGRKDSTISEISEYSEDGYTSRKMSTVSALETHLEEDEPPEEETSRKRYPKQLVNQLTSELERAKTEKASNNEYRNFWLDRSAVRKLSIVSIPGAQVEDEQEQRQENNSQIQEQHSQSPTTLEQPFNEYNQSPPEGPTDQNVSVLSALGIKLEQDSQEEDVRHSQNMSTFGRKKPKLKPKPTREELNNPSPGSPTSTNVRALSALEKEPAEVTEAVKDSEEFPNEPEFGRFNSTFSDYSDYDPTYATIGVNPTVRAHETKPEEQEENKTVADIENPINKREFGRNSTTVSKYTEHWLDDSPTGSTSALGELDINLEEETTKDTERLTNKHSPRGLVLNGYVNPAADIGEPVVMEIEGVTTEVTYF